MQLDEADLRPASLAACSSWSRRSRCYNWSRQR